MSNVIINQQSRSFDWLYHLVMRTLGPLARKLLNWLPGPLKKTWFGSDNYSPYTAEYTWLTNQFGHFAVGAGISSVIFALVLFFHQSPPGASLGPSFYWVSPLCALIGVVGYVLKEVGDIEFERQKQSLGVVFPIDYREIARDGAADVFFVSAGIVLAQLMLLVGLFSLQQGLKALPGTTTVLISAVILILASVAIRIVMVYVPEKRCFDRSGLPGFFRLPRYRRKLEPVQSPDPILAFAREEQTAMKMVVIQGPPGAGKTTLAIGIACEFAHRGKQPRYIKASEFLAEDRERAEGIATIEQAAVLIIDDVIGSDLAALNLPKGKPVVLIGLNELDVSKLKGFCCGEILELKVIAE